MRSLTDEQIQELRKLFATNGYTKKQLAFKFKCSPTTIALWIPIESEYRVIKLQSRRKKDSLCAKCRFPLRGHSRCKNCTILLHGEECICQKTLEEIGYWWK